MRRSRPPAEKPPSLPATPAAPVIPVAPDTPGASRTVIAPIERRRFLRLLAAGGVAVAAGVARPAEAPAADPAAPAAKKPRATREKPARPAAVERELENQRRSVADMLRVIREYELPPGGDLAIAFRPIRARREGR